MLRCIPGETPARPVSLRSRSTRPAGGRLAVALLALLLPAALSGGAAAGEPDHLTLYGAQHPQMLDILVQGFKARTGITIDVRAGDAPEIANQIAEEGTSSPADLYITENSPELLLLEEKGLLAPVDKATLAEVPAQYSSATGAWVGLLARENVLQFNTSMIKEEALPASLLDLAKPEWKGKVAISPTDADFMPIVRVVEVLKGKDAALAWLKGLKDNAQVYDDDEAVVAAVDRGSVAVGLINSYYWYRFRTEAGADKIKSGIHHFAGGDAGALINISGAAALKASKHPQEAQKFLAYVVSKQAQQALANNDIVFEYPLAAGVAANPALKPFSELQPPSINLTQLGDDVEPAQLLRDAGLL
ncbi:extracellular solute-binding protein [Mesorhizobium shangrilense]|uniref:Extracellular solute-binding protein n=1 Tax=Mesorhizobium shangrilense TaxID=460060 RepID=A0ABV2D5Z6_9HYPH